MLERDLEGERRRLGAEPAAVVRLLANHDREHRSAPDPVDRVQIDHPDQLADAGVLDGKDDAPVARIRQRFGEPRLVHRLGDRESGAEGSVPDGGVVPPFEGMADVVAAKRPQPTTLSLVTNHDSSVRISRARRPGWSEDINFRPSGETVFFL